MGFLKRLFGSNDAQRPSAPRSEPGGILGGVFLADEGTVSSWSLTRPTPPEWPAVEFKWLETVKLGTLEAILSGHSYGEIDQTKLHNVVRTGGDEGPWIALVRDELVTLLAEMPDARAHSVAALWANTDEFKARATDIPDQRTIEALTDRVGEMSRLARQGRVTDKRMYLLMGL
jgi:hypothetical protein